MSDSKACLDYGITDDEKYDVVARFCETINRLDLSKDLDILHRAHVNFGIHMVKACFRFWAKDELFLLGAKSHKHRRRKLSHP